MINNQSQGRWILAQGWLPENILTQAFHELDKYPNSDLCQVLVARNLLTHAQADMARRATANNPLTNPSPGHLSVPSLLAPTPASSRIVPVASSSASGKLSASSIHRESGFANPNQSFRATLSQGKNASFVGRRFGNFEIIEEISRGGMGVVLKARNVEIDTMVALKLLLDEEASDASYGRFKQEAQVLARLDHPGIVGVKNFGREENIPFFAMDLIVGQDLKTVVEDQIRETGQVPAYSWTVGVMEKLADALAYCHKEKVMHRDVKPANILIEDGDDRPVLVDFGLVKLKSTDTQDGAGMALSLSGEVRGTPAYMAPEQADPNGDFGSVGKKTDVWGFGATLFFCLTGKDPYSGNSATNIYVALMQKDPPRVSEVNPDVPEWLDELTFQCLQRRAPRRIPISHAARVLAAGLDDVDAAAELLGGSRPKGSRVKHILGALIVVFAVVLGGGMWFYQSQQAALETEDRLSELKEQVEEGLEKVQKSRNRILRRLLKSSAEKPGIPRPSELTTLEATEKSRANLLRSSQGQEEPTEESKKIAALHSDLTALTILCRIRKSPAFDARSAQRALSEIPDAHSISVPVLWARAQVSWKLQKYGEAAQLYRKLMSSQSEEAVFYEELAQLYIGIDDRRSAQQVVEDALRLIPRAESNAGILRFLLEFGDPKKTRSYLERLAKQESLPKELALRCAARAWDLDHIDVWPALSDHLPRDTELPPKVSMLKAAVELLRFHPMTAIRLLEGLSFPNQPELAFKHALFQARAVEMMMDLPVAQKAFRKALSAAKAVKNKVAVLQLYRKLSFIARIQKNPEVAARYLSDALKYAGPNPKPDLSSILQNIYLDEAKARALVGPAKMRSIERRMALSRGKPNGPAEIEKLRKDGQGYITSISQVMMSAERFGRTPDLVKFQKAFHLYITHNHNFAQRFRIPSDDTSSLAERLRAKKMWGKMPWFKNGRGRQAAIEQFKKARYASREPLVEFWLARARWLLPVFVEMKTKVKPSNLVSGLNYALFSDPFDPKASQYYATMLELLGEVKGARPYLENSIQLDPSEPAIFRMLSQKVPPRDRKGILSWAVFCDRLADRAPYVRARLLYFYVSSLNSSKKSPEFAKSLRELIDLAPNDRRYVERARNFYISGSVDYQTYDRRLKTLESKGLAVLRSAQKALDNSEYADALNHAEQCRPYLAFRDRSLASYIAAIATLKSTTGQSDRQAAWLQATKALLLNPSVSDDYYAVNFDVKLESPKAHREMYKSMEKVVPIQPMDSDEWQAWALFLATRLIAFYDDHNAADRRKLRRCEKRLQQLLLKNPHRQSARLALGILLTLNPHREAFNIFREVSMSGAFERHFRRSPLLKALRALTAYQYGDDSYTILLKAARDIGFNAEKWPRLFHSKAAREFLENN